VASVRPCSACLIAAVCALTLAACGGDEGETAEPTTSTAATTTTNAGAAETTAEPPAPDAEDDQKPGGEPTEQIERPMDIEDVIVAVLTGGGTPEQACEELVTDRFVRTAYGSRQGCMAARAPGATARTVEVTDVRESGDSATAVAVPSGGPYDGVDVEVALVADPALEGAWLVDSLLADVPPGP
jgi:hypothetical protein